MYRIRWPHRHILPHIQRWANTHPSQILPKNCRGKNTSKLILWGHHHPDTKCTQNSTKMVCVNDASLLDILFHISFSFLSLIINPKGNQPWIYIRRADAEVEAPILCLLDVKSWLVGKDPDPGKDWGQEKGETEDEMVEWHHWLDRHEFEQIPRRSRRTDAWGCAWGSTRGLKESDTTEPLNNNLEVSGKDSDLLAMQLDHFWQSAILLVGKNIVILTQVPRNVNHSLCLRKHCALIAL